MEKERTDREQAIEKSLDELKKDKVTL